MDLTYTPEQEAFRMEARQWLEANVPSEPLASFDTPDGFEAHRQWEQKLNEGGWAMVPWPVEYGGRGANLLEWLGRAGAGQPERHLSTRPHHHGIRQPRAEGPLPPGHGLQ